MSSIVWACKQEFCTYRTCLRPSLNAQADLFSRASCLIICLRLPLLPCFMYARSEGSSQTAHMRRLTWVFAAARCNMGLDARKHVFWGLGTTKAQTSRCIRSLISAFFIRLLESIRSRLATSILSIF